MGIERRLGGTGGGQDFLREGHAPPLNQARGAWPLPLVARLDKTVEIMYDWLSNTRYIPWNMGLC